jgi:hypothetical protein
MSAGRTCLRFFVAGDFVRFICCITMMAAALVGCSSSAAPTSPTPTNSSIHGGTTGILPIPHITRTVRPVSVVVNSGFATAVRSLCDAFARKDSSAVTRALPYYQYNSGLRYGVLGDGEGQTGDPGLMTSWLAHSSVHCVLQSSGTHGHGTVLATGWHEPGGSALIELDTYSGRWKINDFTFGPYRALYRALQTVRPVIRYAG